MKTYNISRLPTMITLGYDGENNWRPQTFDCSPLLANHPNGTISLWLLPHGETQAFPVALTRDGDSVVWTPLSEEMTAATGALQLVCTDGTDVGKSPVAMFRVDSSIIPGAEHPAAVPSWATQTIERTENAADRAEAAVSHYPKIVNGVWFVWDATQSKFVSTGISAQGEDGVSPTVQTEAITGGHRVTITDAIGAHAFDVMDGEDAQSVYVTPEQFGAVGDGVTDDTAALREALKYCIDNKHVLFLANQYYITAALLTASDYSGEAVLNIEGQKPLSENVYAVSGYGGVKFEAGVNVFDGVSLSGSISRVTFAPTTRTQTGSIFHNCALYSLTFSECTVSNVLAFCHNASLNRNSVVENSRFQTVYYFAKCDSGAQILCTDSTIRGNYINGGMEMTGNHCFEWGGFNGSSISDNFIDYYHTIFYPSFSGSGSFSGGVCAGNNFQVFRHFYIKPANVSGFLFQSLSDCFNWTDPATLQKLSDYDVLTYTGHDGQPHDIPPSILISYETGTISIRDAILQRNVGNVVFLKEGITNYEYARAEMTVINAQGRNYANSVALADSIYGAGTYRKNMIEIPWVRDVQNLGNIGLAWSTVWYPGIRARKDNHVYRYHWVYNGSKWVATWIDETQVVPTMAIDLNMSDWTSGKTVDAAAMKTVVTAAGLRVAALEDDVSALERDKANASDIPTAVSELTNDSDYQTAKDVQTAIAGVRQLPTVTAADNGKFLRVVSGAWAAETVQTWQGGSY